MLLKTSLTYLPGVGAKRATALEKELGLKTYLDLLHYFPYKYIDRTKIYSIREIRSDMPYIQLRGYIRDWQEVGEGRKKRLVAIFSDGTGTIELIWFHTTNIQRIYQIGQEYLIFGKPVFFNGSYSIVHPEIDDEQRATTLLGKFVPMYSLSDKLKNTGINNRSLQQIIHTLLKIVHNHIRDSIPQHILSAEHLVSYAEAIVQIHFPTSAEQLETARRRLKFEELFFIQLKLQSMKVERKTSFQGIIFPKVGPLFNRLYREGLPFDLTNAQKRVLREIRSDLGNGQQMNRLLQGDVGSGKTLVALFSMLLAVDNGYQACLMAPTEILARQHYQSLVELVNPLGLEVGLLIGSTGKRERNRLLPALVSGELKIVIGTHTLLEENVQFKSLGLSVIDEQHRFGVIQRSRMWQKNQHNIPHILIMSATPIPRTLAMTLYGDLDISIIDELPPGRKPIQTLHAYEQKMVGVYSFLREQIKSGRQVYVVYPMIEENEKADMRNLEEGFARYQEIFPEFNLEMVHGKLKSKEKEERMQRFISGESHILLATTVIEVGVNVPNASVMVIEGANRFGLSQLHQLRGRVGRGANQSYCILVTRYELSEDSRRRIQIMVETNDGFEIAEEDMRLRGFGDIDGTRQSGQQISLKIANPVRDSELIQYTRRLAETILVADPQLNLPQHQSIKERLLELYPIEESWGVIS